MADLKPIGQHIGQVLATNGNVLDLFAGINLFNTVFERLVIPRLESIVTINDHANGVPHHARCFTLFGKFLDLVVILHG